MKKSLIIFFIAPFYLVLIAFLMQGNMLLSSDVGCLLNEANQLLSGGKYITDFFETNPPMILYLYAPVCLFAKLTAINIIFSMRLYVFLLAFVSTGLSLHLLKRIIRPKDSIILNFLFFMLLFVMLFLPMHEFGQREHLCLILIMPYLFSATLELENKRIPFALSVAIGLMAGFGFAIKPYFLVTFCLIELSFIVKNRHLLAWIRTESLVIATTLILYLSSILLFHPEYIKIMLPLITHFYFGTIEETWDILLTRPAVIICLLTILYYFLFFKIVRYRTLNTILLLAMIGMVAAFFIPRTGWFYHALPAVSLSMLLVANYLGQLISFYLISKSKKILLLIILALSIYALPVAATFYLYSQYTTVALNPESTYRLMAFINSHPGKQSVYCLTTVGTQDCFPLVLMTDSSYGGRLPFLWWYKGFSKPSQAINEKKFLIDSLAEDLNRYQAKWIIINYFNFGNDGNLLFDFIDQNEKFRKAWQPYKYVMTITQYRIYERITN